MRRACRDPTRTGVELGQEIAHSLIETGSVDSESVMKQEAQRLSFPIACAVPQFADPLVRRLGRGVARMTICLLPDGR
jgi:hypothetical protein